ncbi:mitochondrial intermediate peptidase [Microplitis mediator]|uniref:mitochondrial intermediate peptidase n=1 Tax=Microplitis mediator TaxID=375433 RepID=UPI00255677E1|nr:mitochondrial intermediate peptidase [Microplitis mediator]
MLRILREYLKKSKGRRSVSTWSPLAKAFNNYGPAETYAVDLSPKPSGLFGLPELRTAEGFSELKDQAISDSDRLIEEAVGHDRTRKMVQIFDDLSDSLCRVADLAEFIRIAHPDHKYAEAAEDTCLAVSGIVEKLNTHRGLYNSLSRVVESGDIKPTTEIDDHVSKLFLFDFEQCGIHLPEDLRRQVVQINDKILQVGQKFMAGAVTPRSVDSDLLPEHIRQYFLKEGDHILVNGLFTDSANALAREAAYKIFLYPDDRQENLLKELLNSRHQLAEICGFPTYAHRAIRGSTVETPEVVRAFLDILNVEMKDRANRDFDVMREMKKAETSVQQALMPWDTTYFTTKVKKMWLGTSNNEFAPYFSLGACMDGLNILTQSLYGVRLEPEPAEAGEIWAPNVQKLAVVDENEGTLGHIYCDFFEREGKPNQDCHFTIRGGRLLADGTYQNPVVVLMLSLPSPRWNNPCLLSPSAVDNLFHEMGHALHSMLGRTQYQHVTGTRCSSDFAEVPSVLMEYFASDKRIIKLFAKHYQTQESLPDDMIEKLCASKNVFPASELQVQVFYSMLDHVYHSKQLQGSTTKTLAEIQNNYYGLPYVENTAWQLRFSHLVGYGAKYYSYLISRAIASWIWQTYFQRDPLSRSAGEKYRRECLAHGGGKPSSKVVSDFLNKEASALNFANALVNEIDEKDQHVQSILALNK